MGDGFSGAPHLSPSQNLCLSLQDHVSPDVRIKALSTFIQSAASAQPFSSQALDILKNILPGYHGESDAQVRNEFLSVIKRLCTRLRDTIRRLQKAKQREIEGDTTKTTIKWTALISEADNNQAKALNDHVRFFRWYCAFLDRELQPTASYQRHITSLKIVHNIITSRLYEAHGVSNKQVPKTSRQC